MVARNLESRVMAIALMPLPSGQLSNMVCTGILKKTGQRRAALVGGIPGFPERLNAARPCQNITKYDLSVQRR